MKRLDVTVINLSDMSIFGLVLPFGGVAISITFRHSAAFNGGAVPFHQATTRHDTTSRCLMTTFGLSFSDIIASSQEICSVA